MLNQCMNNPEILEAIRLIKIVIELVCIFAPIIAIIMQMLDVVKATISNGADEISKNIKQIIPRILALGMVFLVPAFVNMGVSIATDYSAIAMCMENANKEYINTVYVAKANELLNKAEKDYNPNDYSKIMDAIYQIDDSSQKTSLQNRASKYKEVLDSRKKVQAPAKIQGGDSSLTASTIGGKAYEVALKQIGKPYIWGAAGPNSFDCSGMVWYVYKEAGFLYKKTRDTVTTILSWTPVINIPSLDQAQLGDLIFINWPGSSSYGHIALYAGKDSKGKHQWLHAAGGQSCPDPKKTCKVVISSVGGYAKIEIRRVVG